MDKKKFLRVVASVKDWFSVRSSVYSANPNEKNKSLQDLAAYLDDPHVTACVQSRKSGVLKQEFTLWDNDSDPAIFEFIKTAIDKLDTQAISSQMLNYSLFGFQPMEIYYTEFNGRLIINDVKAKPPYWFKFDDNEAIKFVGTNLSDKLAPKYKIVVIRNNPTYTNPYGEALLAKIHFNMQFKKLGLNYYAQYIENYGMPYTHVTVTNPTDLDAAVEVAENIKSNSIAVSTDGISCNLIESTNANAANYESFIKLHNDEISKAILGQTLTTQEGVSGSYALGMVQASVRKDIIDYDKRNVEAAWNEIIYNLVNINFGNVERCPIVQFKEEMIVDTTRAQRDSVLFADGATGFKPTLEYLVREYGFLETDLTKAPEPIPVQTNSFVENEDTINFATTNSGKKYNLTNFSGVVQDIITETLNYIENGESFDEMEKKLMETFDGVDDSNVSDYIGTAIALSSYAGRIDGAK